MSGASERANGRASGPAFYQRLFLIYSAHLTGGHKAEFHVLIFGDDPLGIRQRGDGEHVSQEEETAGNDGEFVHGWLARRECVFSFGLNVRFLRASTDD